MPTVYFQYSYSRMEAKPRDFDPLGRDTVPGTSVTYSTDLTIYDPNETAVPWYRGWEFDRSTGHDYARRTVTTITNIKPEGGSGKASGFDDLAWQPNAWGSAYVSDEEYQEIVRNVPIELNRFGEDHSGGDKLASGWSANSGSAKSSWGSISFSVSPGLSLRSAYDYVTDYAAKISPTIANYVNVVDRVVSLRATLTEVMENSFDLLEYGITNFEDVSAKEFSKRTDMLLRDSYSDFLSELETQLGASNGASRILRTVNLIGDFSSGQADLEVSYSESAPASGGLAILGVDVRVFNGSEHRDVVATTAAPKTALWNVGPRFFDLGSGDDVFSGSANAGEQFFGRKGDDIAYMAGGADVAYGGNGRDKIDGAQGDDILFGGHGGDTLIGGKGNDEIFGEKGRDLSRLGAGADLYEDHKESGRTGRDTVFGGGGNDTVRGGGGQDSLLGQTGDDFIFGGTGRDIVKGGPGNDTLKGGPDGDYLLGGSGSDTFSFSRQFGNDTIGDFDSRDADERIDLSGVETITDFRDLRDNHLKSDGGDVIIFDGGGNSVRLENLTRSDLDAGDFIF